MSARTVNMARGEQPLDDHRSVTAGVFCLIGIAAAHLLDLPGHWQDAPYIAVLFGLLAAASLALAVLLARGVMPELAWPAAGALAGTALVGFVWSRTIGLPQIEDHLGEWRDPVAIGALVFEVVLVGLTLPSLRSRAVRVAPAASLVAAGLVGAGLISGEAAGHGHGAGGHGHSGMNLATATAPQRQWGRDHLDRALAAARRRFPTIEAARAAGYELLPRSYAAQRDLDFWHLTNLGYQKDRDYINPERPESLMYWKNPDGKPVLIAYIYRIPRRVANPAQPGPLFSWHLHHNRQTRRPGLRKMVHLWLLPRLEDGFAAEMPLSKLSTRYGVPEDGGSGAGVTG